MKKKMPVPLEHDEQVAFAQWAEMWLPKDLRGLFWANPNGGLRNQVVAIKLKAEGCKPGVPDITFAWPCGGYHGLYIEMKRIRGGVLSKEQKEKIADLRMAGYRVEVCKGFEAAKKVLTEYMLGDGRENDDA